MKISHQGEVQRVLCLCRGRKGVRNADDLLEDYEISGAPRYEFPIMEVPDFPALV